MGTWSLAGPTGNGSGKGYGEDTFSLRTSSTPPFPAFDPLSRGSVAT